MDCTLILHTDGQREIRYGIDVVANTKDIESYMYSPVPDEKVEEIKTASLSRVQEILSKIF